MTKIILESLTPLKIFIDLEVNDHFFFQNKHCIKIHTNNNWFALDIATGKILQLANSTEVEYLEIVNISRGKL